MPIDYLRTVEHMKLPLKVEDQRSVECVRVLRAAGMVLATITTGEAGSPDVAVIESITDKGRVVLAQYVQGKALP